MEKYNYICDYYVCFNKKSEFIYMALEDVKSYRLSKAFLHNDIFSNFPKLANRIKQTSEIRYIKNIREVLIFER